MTMLDFARLFVGLCWLMVAVCLSGSMWRLFVGPSRPNDPIWSLFWFFGAHQLGYTVRWLMSWTHDPTAAGDFASVLGLNTMSALLALAVVWQRLTIEGRRW